MKQYEIELESLQPYIMTKMLDIQKEQREKHEEFDIRIWKEKGHYTEDGHVKIPGVMFKRSLESAAKYLKEKIPGQRMATYSKPFLSAVQIVDDIVLPTTKDAIEQIKGTLHEGTKLNGKYGVVLMVAINCHADGRRGSGTRVVRRFPMVPKWEGKLTVFVGDDIITKDVLIRHIKAAGQFVGIGGFRAESGNQSGRFRIKTNAKGEPMVKESEVEL